MIDLDINIEESISLIERAPVNAFYVLGNTKKDRTKLKLIAKRMNREDLTFVSIDWVLNKKWENTTNKVVLDNSVHYRMHGETRTLCEQFFSIINEIPNSRW